MFCFNRLEGDGSKLVLYFLTMCHELFYFRVNITHTLLLWFWKWCFSQVTFVCNEVWEVCSVPAHHLSEAPPIHQPDQSPTGKNQQVPPLHQSPQAVGILSGRWPGLMVYLNLKKTTFSLIFHENALREITCEQFSPCVHGDIAIIKIKESTNLKTAVFYMNIL